MAGIDDLIAARAQERGLDPPMAGPMDMPADEAPKTGVTAGTNVPLITGSLAKALNRDSKESGVKDIDSIIHTRLIERSTGKTPERRERVFDESEKEVLGRPKEPLDALIEERTKAKLDEEQPLQLADPKAVNIKDSEKRYNKITGEGVGGLGRPLLLALNAEENAEVKVIRKALRLPENKDHLDNTYSNLLKDYGFSDSALTEAAGMGLAIVTAPSTYLTFGQSAMAKVGTKTALSSTGRKVAIEIAKDRAEKTIAERAAQGALDRAVENKIRTEAYEQVQKELATHFGEISKVTKGVTVGEDVKALKSNVFDRGGVKFFGKTVLGGEEIAQAVKETGIDKVFLAPSRVAKKATTATVETVKQLPGAQTVAKAAEPAVQTIGKYYKQTKDTLGELFVHNYGVDKKVVDLWDDTLKQSREIYDRMYENTNKMFEGYGIKSQKQREDFFNSVNEAFGNKDLVGKVTSKTGDPTVQKAIDRWLGQGEFSGRRPITDKLAKYAKLAEGDEQVNWIPGIDRRFINKAISPRLQAVDGPSTREFNIARKTDGSEYLRDPVQAIAIRRTQAYVANLQDKMFDNIIKEKLGGLRKFSSRQEAALYGYVPLVKPYEQKFLSAVASSTDDISKVSSKSDAGLYYVEKEFYDKYKKLVTDPNSRMNTAASFLYKVVEKPTQIYKRHVTVWFPSFHARNFTSNLALNAMSIGGHAFNPVTHKHAMDMVRGTNLDKILTNTVGEKLALKDVLKEAEKHGVLKSGSYFADIGGELLPKDAKELWSFKLSTLDPRSPDFVPSAFVKKVGSIVEDQSKLVNYLTWRMKGYSPKVAAMEAKEALFDYGALTDHERWFKLAIPFYTFSKKNLERFVKLGSHRPGVITAQLRAIEKLGPTDREWEDMPDWAKNKFVLRAGGMLTSGYGMPIEDILGLTGSGAEILSRTNPLFRYPLEKVAGKDFMSGRPLEDLQSAKEWKLVYQISKDPKSPAPLKKAAEAIVGFMGLKRDKTNPTKMVADFEKLHLLRNMFTSRYMSTLGMLNDGEKDMLEKAARLMLGVIKVKPDREISLSNKKREVQAETIKYYKKMGGKGIYIFVPTSEDTEEIREQFRELSESDSKSELKMGVKEIKNTIKQEFR